MPLITSISDRIVALELGRVIATGTPDEVLARPAGRGVVPRHRPGDDRPVGRPLPVLESVS